jgi:hypothetical protein
MDARFYTGSWRAAASLLYAKSGATAVEGRERQQIEPAQIRRASREPEILIHPAIRRRCHDSDGARRIGLFLSVMPGPTKLLDDHGGAVSDFTTALFR